jgi:hypothetical protein
MRKKKKPFFPSQTFKNISYQHCDQKLIKEAMKLSVVMHIYNSNYSGG